jgi:hypothetical protein
MKAKSLWRGVFNYSHEATVQYAYAFSKEQARVVMCRRLAKKHDVHPSIVLGMFNGDKDNYSIGIELEIKEDV